jgi:hypothetical protein
MIPVEPAAPSVGVVPVGVWFGGTTLALPAAPSEDGVSGSLEQLAEHSTSAMQLTQWHVDIRPLWFLILTSNILASPRSCPHCPSASQFTERLAAIGGFVTYRCAATMW